MKTKKISKKLSFNKKTIANLNGLEMNNLNGGAQTFGKPCSLPCETEFPTPRCTLLTEEIFQTCIGAACFPTGSPCPIPR